MKKSYVEKRDGGYWVAGTRISLDSVVYAFRRGASPETIKGSFPSLELEEIYGALTFYLGNQAKIDAYLAESEIQLTKEAGERRSKFEKANPELAARIISSEVLSR